MSTNAFTSRLHEHRLRGQLCSHPFFRSVHDRPINKSQAAMFIGQWWHPLHYFPTFLARCVAVLPDIESKCAIANILSQESGEGNPSRAHEAIYIDTMRRAGFERSEIVAMPPFAETKALVTGYRQASRSALSAFGFVFATEVSDLAMVSGIGNAVSRATGARDLEWVNVHVQQEPDHVEEADHALLRDFQPAEASVVMSNAELMWRLWIRFFDRLERETFGNSRLRERAETDSAAA